MNDVPCRVFESLDDYRAWADRELPRYLGYYSFQGVSTDGVVIVLVKEGMGSHGGS